MRKVLALFTAAALAITPAAAQRTGRYLDPRDIAEAQKDNADLVEEFGGAETGPRAAYVESVGRRVTAYSGVANPAQSFHFITLNSAVENAFSVPGGYIYVTRQLMGLMNDESELAFALGHEAGHVAANHAHIREQYAERNPLGVFGQILGAVFGDQVVGGLVRQRAQLQQLSFSRDQEYEADTLGIRYLIAAGYDPAGAAGLLGALSRETALQARAEGRSNRQTPEWASTHPLSENRMQRALAEGQATGRLGVGVRNRDQYLNAINGIMVDDDPAQGIIDGPVFTHPDLRIQFSVPAGYLMSNGTYAVTISGSAGKAQFGGGASRLSLGSTIAGIFQELVGRPVALPPTQRLTVNGMAAALVTARFNTIDVSVIAYQSDAGHVYHFIMLTRAGYGVGPFVPMINSLRRITPDEAAAIRPRVIRIVRVAPGDTVQSLAAQMAYRDLKVERFLTLNGMTATAPLTIGQRLKLVVLGGRAPARRAGGYM